MKSDKFKFFLGFVAVVAVAGLPPAAMAGTAVKTAVPPLSRDVAVLSGHKLPRHVAAPAAKRNLAIRVGGGGSLTINGFLNVVGFAQDQPYAVANGVFGTFPAAVSPTAPNAKNAQTITGGDVRNTRVMVSFSHPLADGWMAGGFVSSDFEGGFNGAGIVSGQQQIMRLRQMFITLSKGATTFKIGEALTLVGVQFPYSLAHLAEPNGFFWASGVWWYPGVAVTRNYRKGSSTWSVTGQVQQGNSAGPGSTTNYETAGNTGFRPQWEARVIYGSKTAGGTPWSAFVVGQYERIDLGGPFGIPAAGNPPAYSYASYIVEAGGSYAPGKFVVKGNITYGQGMANNLFDFIQSGAIKFHGGWVQAGYHFRPHWGIYAGYYYNNPTASDVRAWGGHYLTGKAFTTTLAYDLGTYGVALEWMHNIQDYTNAGVDSTIIANQVTLSAIYRF